MDLAPTGRLIAWLGVALLLIGFPFFNTLILLSAALLFLYLLFEGFSTHRAIDLAKNSIKLQSYPSTIETTVGRPLRIGTVIENNSHFGFKIARFSHNIPTQIDEEIHAPATLALSSHRERRIETLLRTKIPGNFELTTSTMLLERRASMFRQSVRFPDKVVIIARPLVSRSVNPVDAGILADLAVDHLRRGSGTDLAGTRLYTFLDDFHRIDWKATARTGKLMTRESYLEREPAIVLMIDVSSSVKTARREMAIMPALISEAGNLLAAIRPESPVGLILYDEQTVIANVDATVGVENRERILRAILEAAKSTSNKAPQERRAIRPYAELARETDALLKERVFAARTKADWERFSSFASVVLPFYKRAQSKYFQRLRKQGVFRAFEIICNLPEPVLVIAISDGETNLDGLAEGTKNARTLNHQVVLAILAEPTKRIEILSDLEAQSVGVLRCRPEELSTAIIAEVIGLNHSRIIPVEAAR